ncbi:protein LORF2I [Spheniscid alphaherpesvirus 1]|uniref:Protein LORF2I n=1 Tax=Spheniscid alphaherpesvirus 1 TaxID=2560777 RepID=A0A1R3T8R2_9ALPH|nr:protein LORF2I [Spheniscid alphaherpesvirus 1]SCO83611.1 protein LORF2I [Spheniscid alphaherpesvirus 1]
MAFRVAPPFPTDSDNGDDVSIPESVPNYRLTVVRRILTRLFPTTLQIVKSLEPKNGQKVDEAQFTSALKIIGMHEKVHIGGRQQNGTNIPLAALDGLYSACRGLACEAVYMDDASSDLIHRLSTSWVVTMRLVLNYPQMVGCLPLSQASGKYSLWMGVIIEKSKGKWQLWAFWKILEQCIDWCCMFHSPNDECTYGIPRIGPLWEAAVNDLDRQAAVTDIRRCQLWSKAPCIVCDDESNKDAENEHGSNRNDQETDRGPKVAIVRPCMKYTRHKAKMSRERVNMSVFRSTALIRHGQRGVHFTSDTDDDDVQVVDTDVTGEMTPRNLNPQQRGVRATRTNRTGNSSGDQVVPLGRRSHVDDPNDRTSLSPADSEGPSDSPPPVRRRLFPGPSTSNAARD